MEAYFPKMTCLSPFPEHYLTTSALRLTSRLSQSLFFVSEMWDPILHTDLSQKYPSQGSPRQQPFLSASRAPRLLLGFALQDDPDLLRFDILSSRAPNKQQSAHYASLQASYLCCQRAIYYLGGGLRVFVLLQTSWRPVSWSAILCKKKKSVKDEKRHLKPHLSFCFDSLSRRVLLKW